MANRRRNPGRTGPLAFLLLVACAAPGRTGSDVPLTANPIANPFRTAPGDTAQEFGVRFRLTDLPSAAEAGPRATGSQPLPTGAAEALLERLVGPALEMPAEAGFRFATRTMPAPRPGVRTTGSFIGTAAQPPEIAEAGPPRALFTSPQGKIATASQISVTFSRPMVALAALDDSPPVVRLSPELPGSWRWLDPYTLVFEAVGGLPKATRFSVEIPAGLASPDGQVLREAVHWSFETTPPVLSSVAATDGPELGHPVIALVFDQRIDAAAVLPFLRLEVEGREIPLRLATAAEQAHQLVGYRLRPSPPERTVAIRAVEPVRSRAADQVKAVLRVLPGLPSLEGPERTSADANHDFNIRLGLRVVEHGCGRSDVCRPGVPWTIRFNHELGPTPPAPSLVRIEPALPGATVEVWHNHLVVLGSPEAGETYTVRVDPGVRGPSGETLGDSPPLRFDIQPALPSLWTPGGGLAVLRPGEPSRYLILAEGVDSIHVRARVVSPLDWPAYANRMIPVARSGRELFETVLPVMPAAAGPGEAVVDLDAALDSAGGHVLLTVLPATDSARDDEAALTWVQRGNMVLDVAEDVSALTVRVTSDAGLPVEGVRLELFAADQQQLASVLSDERGIAKLLADDGERGHNWTLVATKDEQTMLLPAKRSGDDPWSHRRWVWRPEHRSHFLTDRPIYEPGDTVHFVGWLRRAEGIGKELVAPQEGTVVLYSARGPRSETLVEDSMETGVNGRIQGAIVLPREVNSGSNWVRLYTHDGAWGGHLAFEIEEVRRPNFEVSVVLEPGTPTPGDTLAASVRAHYFTGGALPGADISWRIMAYPAWFSPPGASDYKFGWARFPDGKLIQPTMHSASTDATGEHHLEIAIESVQPAIPMSLMLEASVADLDEQQRSATTSIVVHPADVYVGLRTESRFVREGEQLIIDAVVVDPDGRPVSDRPVTMLAMRQEQQPAGAGGTSVIHETQQSACELRSRSTAVRCRMRNLPAGDYLVVASVEDKRGRRSNSELAVRVAGETIPAFARGTRDTVSVTPDREEYAPGDTAYVIVQTSLHASHTLLTVRRGGVLDVHDVKLEAGNALVRVPIRDAHAPNVELHVAAVAPGGVHSVNSAPITVSPLLRTLTVAVTPRATEVAPGTHTSVVVQVTDHAGLPVRDADITLSGIDESLLALGGRRFTDPIADIYQHSSPGVVDHDLRAHIAPRASGAGNGTITGIVLNGATGRPIAYAWVEVPGRGGVLSGPDGSYQLENVPAGAHRLVAQADGYVSGQARDVEVSPGNAARAHFQLLTREAVLVGGRSVRQMARRRALGSSVSHVSLDALVVTGESIEVAATQFESADLAGGEAASLLRQNFTPVAAFVVGARTGQDGRAEIALTVPDNLTRYRLRAEVAQGDRLFGAGESTLTARLPLMVRAVPPRFLHQGDRFELPVLVENRTGNDLEVEVAVRATNAEVQEPNGRTVLVPAEDRMEVRFPVITGRSGKAHFQIAAAPAAGGPAVLAPGDAAQVTIPVLVPAVTEAFAVYGQLDDARPVAYPLELPAATLPGQSRVELGFSTTAAHGLRDALWFLWDCFFDFPEVWASRTIALSALQNIPSAAPWPNSSIAAAIRTDVTRLARAQLQDGGWSFWSSRFDADPFVTVNVTHALQRAQASGVKVPERTLADALNWLRRLDENAPDSVRSPHPGAPTPFSIDFPLQARRAVLAYALDVRHRLGDDVSASASALLRKAGANALPAEALAWLLPALRAESAYAGDAAEVRRELSNRMVRSAGTAGVVSPYDAGGRRLHYTPRRTDAVVLGALAEDGSSPELVAALARGLMAHRVRGRWSNTQENAFAVAALAEYLSTAEAIEPDGVARTWAGARLAGEHSFRGRSDERYELAIPTDSLGSPGDELDLILAREGVGRLYYRVGLSYAKAGMTPPMARGFEIERTYEAVDDSADVRRSEDGTWHVRRGARVRVRLTVASAGPRYHVAMIDPLPAGFEAVNPYLEGTSGLQAPAALDSLRSTRRAPHLPLEHVNVKNDRFEAFTTLLQPGRGDIVYLALATTPGDFAAPAPRAEEMYAPETFGRGAAERVVIEVVDGRN